MSRWHSRLLLLASRTECANSYHVKKVDEIPMLIDNSFGGTIEYAAYHGVFWPISQYGGESNSSSLSSLDCIFTDQGVLDVEFQSLPPNLILYTFHMWPISLIFTTEP